MSDSALTSRAAGAGDHLQLMVALSREIERAIDAICGNHLEDFEDSVIAQRELCSRIESVTSRSGGEAALRTAAHGADPPMAAKIRTAAFSLQQLNRRYSILLSHSSQAVTQMSSLFSFYRDQTAKSSDTGHQHKTASWQV